MPLFSQAEFHATVANLAALPDDSVAEAAFAGRSNAGKSSAINALAGRSRLAFVSKLPGRTQHLNYFRVADGRYWVDLPGYGFARAPAEIREQWEGLLAPYLMGRAPLAGLMLIMDARHPLTELDLQMIDWFARTGKPIHVLLSKADKLSRNEQARVLREVRAALAGRAGIFSVQLFSSLKRAGIEEAENVLASWLGLTPGETPPAPATPAPPAKPPRPRKRSAQGWSARNSGKK
ncbi:MAG: ribosome biogenesis GTP-binding protein YihA/YsxC [Candidatus Accumulibacter sp.]|jgi:GTP-binding protein|nr:ribosome biogenesis GTP-binding protein YihA/YsxC [Accumulibacter sp.]